MNKSEIFIDEESRNLAEKWKNNDFENSTLITTVRHPFARLGKFLRFCTTSKNLVPFFFPIKNVLLYNYETFYFLLPPSNKKKKKSARKDLAKML